MHQWISVLSQNNVGRVLENEPLAKYTTWKIGGPADALVIPENKEQMVNLVQLFKSIRSLDATWTGIKHAGVRQRHTRCCRETRRGL